MMSDEFVQYLQSEVRWFSLSGYRRIVFRWHEIWSDVACNSDSNLALCWIISRCCPGNQDLVRETGSNTGSRVHWPYRMQLLSPLCLFSLADQVSWESLIWLMGSRVNDRAALQHDEYVLAKLNRSKFAWITFRIQMARVLPRII